MTFYEGVGPSRIFKHVRVLEHCGKYYLPVDSAENVSQANGSKLLPSYLQLLSINDENEKIPGTTTWEAVRIIQGPANVQIDITDFAFSTSKEYQN